MSRALYAVTCDVTVVTSRAMYAVSIWHIRLSYIKQSRHLHGIMYVAFYLFYLADLDMLVHILCYFLCCSHFFTVFVHTLLYVIFSHYHPLECAFCRYHGICKIKHPFVGHLYSITKTCPCNKQRFF